MNAPFPSTSQEFYRSRDDRSNDCVPNRAYQTVQCTIRVARDLVHTYAGQVMLIVACNLLSRWCRRIDIELPPVKKDSRIGLVGAEVTELIALQMHDADPFGAFRFSSSIPETGEIELHIGRVGQHDSPTVTIDAGGWFALIYRDQDVPIGLDRDECNPIGAAAAACLGVAQAFKHAVRLSGDVPRPIVFDAHRLMTGQKLPERAEFPADLDFGKLLMIGGGSVGSAAAYFLRLLNAASELKTVDHDTCKVENFNRSPIFGKSTYGIGKARAIAAFLERSKVHATFFDGDWNRFGLEHPRGEYDFDIWLPVANERNVRWLVQNAFPPLMIHASTGRNWAVNFGRHVPHRDDCIVDRFPGGTVPLKCAEGEVQTPAGRTDAALPFLSFFAGLLIVADLIRLRLPGYPQIPNHALLWVGDGLSIQAWDRQPRPTCICRQQPQQIWRKYNGTTRYAYVI